MYNFNNAVTWFLDHEDFLTGDFVLFSEIWLIYDEQGLDQMTSDNYSIIEQMSRNKTARKVTEYSTERRSLDELYVSIRYDVGYSIPEGLAFVTSNETKQRLIAKLVFDQSWRVNTGTNMSYPNIFKFNLPYMLVNTSVKMYPNISLYSKKSIYSPIGEELVSVGEHHHDSYSVLSSSSQDTGRKLAASNLTAQKSMSAESISNVAGEVGTYQSDGTATNINGYRMMDPSTLDDLLEENDIPSRILSDPELLADITEEFIAKNNSVQLLGHELRENQVSGDLTTNSNLRILTTDSTGYDRNLCGLSIDTFRNWLLSSYTISSNVTQELTTVITDIETSSVFNLKFTKASQIAIVKNLSAMGSATILSIPVYIGDRLIQNVSILPRHTVKIVSVIEENDVRSIYFESNSVLERLYPIGSYYWTQNNWNPSYMFGGTWVQPAETRGRFLYAINSNNSSINTNGGAPTHTLTLAQIPDHTHYQWHDHNWTKFWDNANPDHWEWRGDPKERWAYEDTNSGSGHYYLVNGTGRDYGLMYRSNYKTGPIWGYLGLDSTYSGDYWSGGAGSSYPHENMPPYIVAYLWRRTA